MALHSSLTGTDLHENKGVSSASDNTVASATSNATVWRKVNSNMVDTTSIFNTNKEIITLVFTDVSTPEVLYCTVPYACTITQIDTVLQNAITIANSTLTAKNHSGGSMGTITVAFSGSAAGDQDQLIPSSNNTLTAGQRFSIETDGASTTVAKLFVTVSLTRTA